MSVPTQPAFVVTPKGWSDDILSHPIGPFLHEHEQDWDAKKFETGKPYYTDNFTFVKSTGQTFTGEEAVKTWVGEYAIFSAHYHEPSYGVITETEAGYRLFATATIYTDLVVPGEKKCEDLLGRKWENKGYGAVIFNIAKDPKGVHGYKMSSFQFFGDPTPILAEAIKRGIVPVEAITGGS